LDDADIVAESALFAFDDLGFASSFGLSIESGRVIPELNATLQSAFVAATIALTRTPVAVQSEEPRDREHAGESDPAREDRLRHKTVGDGHIISLGMLPRPTRQPRAVPATAPPFRIMSVTGRWGKLRSRWRIDPARAAVRRDRPATYTLSYGPQAPTDPRDYHFREDDPPARSRTSSSQHVPARDGVGERCVGSTSAHNQHGAACR
jgi:hypothetical protein